MYIARQLGFWLTVGAVVAVATLVSGCGGGGGGAAQVDSYPPTVRVSSYTRLLPPFGGTATFEIDARDDVGISKVEVKITAPNGQVTTVTANYSAGRGLYVASYTAPVNPGTTAMIYRFTAYAVDTSGKTSSDGEYLFQVSSADTPPNPPPFGISQ